MLFPLTQSGKLVTRFKCGVRIMYLCLHNHILFAGLSSGSVLCIDIKVWGCQVLEWREGEEGGRWRGSRRRSRDRIRWKEWSGREHVKEE